MTTFAQVYDGCAHNIVVGASLEDALSGIYPSEWITKESTPVDEGGQGRPWIEVPDTDVNGALIVHGAKASGNGAFTNPIIVAKTPNTPNNPYFGKKAKTPKAFWGHMTAVYIALAPGADAGEKQANGLNRLGRIITSQTAAPIIKVAEGVDWVDPDDKDGDFLKMVGLLTTTKHEDGKLLMELSELAAAMAAWT